MAVSESLMKEMKWKNSQIHFLYRQFFVTPPPLPRALSLAGQTAIITGSNTGLGFDASLQLLQQGLSHLILAVRSISKGEDAKERLLSTLGKGKQPPAVEIWELDMSSYESIKAFTERAKAYPKFINMAILNAAALNPKHTINPGTENESTIQINWLSTALLAILLRPILQSKYEALQAQDPSTKPPVLSLVGSETAGWTKFGEADLALKNETSITSMLNDEKNFDGNVRYQTSKLLLLCFFRSFCANLVSDPKIRNDVIVNNVNPGFCYGTELHRNVTGPLKLVIMILARLTGRSTTVGARTLAHAGAVAGVESHGRYLSDCHVEVFVPFVETEEGRLVQQQLWDEAREQLEGVVGFGKGVAQGLL